MIQEKKNKILKHKKWLKEQNKTKKNKKQKQKKKKEKTPISYAFYLNIKKITCLIKTKSLKMLA